jgi:precorrin-2 dehydrogenase / sirohydrochlorin ferrochelatase
MQYYPIFLDLRGRLCLVVGSGSIGTRKTEGLLAAGAIVTIISPQTNKKVTRWATEKKVSYLQRPYCEGDLKGYFIAFAATGVAEIDVLMACEASREGVLLNVVDRPILCNFISPALLQRGDLAIAVSTGGKCPGLAKRLRQKLERTITPEYSIVLDAVAAARHAVLSDLSLSETDKRRRIDEILDSGCGSLI